MYVLDILLHTLMKFLHTLLYVICSFKNLCKSHGNMYTRGNMCCILWTYLTLPRKEYPTPLGCSYIRLRAKLTLPNWNELTNQVYVSPIGACIPRVICVVS